MVAPVTAPLNGAGGGLVAQADQAAVGADGLADVWVLHEVMAFVFVGFGTHAFLGPTGTPVDGGGGHTVTGPPAYSRSQAARTAASNVEARASNRMLLCAHPTATDLSPWRITVNSGSCISFSKTVIFGPPAPQGHG
jgi:hypothetical protein